MMNEKDVAMDESGDLVPENLKQSRPSATPSTGKSLSDYKIVKEIGEGSFSVVYLATQRQPPHKEVAIKMLVKNQVTKQKRVAAVHREKNILIRLSSEENRIPFIINLDACFQDVENLYFVTTYAKHGDLLHIMLKKPEKHFNLSDSVFYASEILFAIQHLHRLLILHRDLKPENVLVAASGHIFLTDFGVARDFTVPRETIKDEKPPEGRKRNFSFVGTAQYVSPEILEGEPQSSSADLWSFGVIIFQLLTGRHCFHDESEYLIFLRIQKLLYTFPDDFPAPAHDLIERLLVIDPAQRLGSEQNGGPEALRSHAFFKGVNWLDIVNAKPPSVE